VNESSLAGRLTRSFLLAALFFCHVLTCQAQVGGAAVTDAQISYCLSRVDAKCKKVGVTLLEQGRLSEGFEISRIYAEQGDVELQLALGALILSRQTPGSMPHGRTFGNPRVYAEAARYWFEKAAQGGSVLALRLVARTYCCYPGLGLGASAIEVQAALPYFRRAAEKDDGASAYLLGEIYATGSGVSRDRQVARSFLRAALESKSSDAAEAKTLAGQLLARIDSDEQAEQQKIVDDRLARERAVRDQEQMRIAELERRERERIDREKQLAAEREAARLAQEKEDRGRPMREAEERAREARAQAQQRQQCDAVVRVCKGRPEVSLEVAEELSRFFRVPRRAIELSRTRVKQSYWCTCSGVFSTPVGDYECALEQNPAGVVTQATCTR